MQSWRGALLATLLLLAMLRGGWHWGVPALGKGMVALLPATLDTQVGEAGPAALDRDWLQPSRLGPAQQAAVRRHWSGALAQHWAATPGAPPVPAWQLHLRHMPVRPGPADGQRPADAQASLGLASALALPGGTQIVTDALALLLGDRPDVLIGVLGHALGHALGHVQHRHGMGALAQAR